MTFLNYKELIKEKERRENFKTTSGIELDRIYLPDKKYDYLSKLGFPGEYPFTRGIQPTMYRGKLWTMRQYAGFGTARESNKRYKFLLETGQTGVSVAFDLPTQIGYDSDHPLSRGEVGKVGVAIDSLNDMEILFDNIPLDKVSTSMTINAPACILLAMYICVGRKQGVDEKKLQGTIQNDILKEYIARGTYIFPPKPSMRIITDIFKYSSINLPLFNTISISGYHIREAGSNAVQELAFTIANGITYVQAAIDADLDVDDFAPRLSFFFNAHNNFLEEIAKFRAARRIWAKIMKEKFKAKKPRSMMLRFHTQTAGSTLTASQPDNNIIRITLQALAAVLGGTQSLHTNSKDEALSLPTEESVRIALRTQQIIAYESGVTDTIDPLAGAYALEYLTDEIENRVFEYLKKIDSMGGMIEAIKSGYIQSEIAESAYRYQKSIESNEKKVVSVNIFTEKEKQKTEVLKVDESIEREQINNLKKLKKKRDNALVRNRLKALENIGSSDNIMPFIIDAVSSYATIGEICDVLRKVFGEYKESIRI
ncbi:MAG: methylmalonyl-CoA mutase family protein [Candidatus Hydrogenedentota bacterium]